jgi:hypothetical protein
MTAEITNDAAFQAPKAEFSTRPYDFTKGAPVFWDGETWVTNNYVMWLDHNYPSAGAQALFNDRSKGWYSVGAKSVTPLPEDNPRHNADPTPGMEQFRDQTLAAELVPIEWQGVSYLRPTFPLRDPEPAAVLDRWRRPDSVEIGTMVCYRPLLMILDHSSGRTICQQVADDSTKVIVVRRGWTTDEAVTAFVMPCALDLGRRVDV